MNDNLRYKGWDFQVEERNGGPVVRISAGPEFFDRLTSYYDNSTRKVAGIHVDVPETIKLDSGEEYKVVGINNSTFDGIVNIKSIHIPKWIEKIEWGFWNCDHLERFDVDPENANFTSIRGVLYSKDVKTLIAYPNNYPFDEYHVDERTSKIQNKAFKCCKSLKTLYIPDSVRDIGVNAFYQCPKLKDVYLPDELRCISNTDNHKPTARFHYRGEHYSIDEIAEMLKFVK